MQQPDRFMGIAAPDDGLPQRGYNPRRRPRWWLVVLIVLGHVAVGLALARLLAPQFTARMVEHVTEGFTVIVTTPLDPPPPRPEPDEGAAGDPGREATARNQTAPENPLPSSSPMPRAASTGAANESGARAEGDGTGSGNGGQGRGGGIASGPSVRSGQLNEARDFPVPEGGRQARFGKAVTVHFTVTADGRARDCTVAVNQVDEATAALVCPLVIAKIHFNPAMTADGRAVEARYGYRVDFRRRD